MTRGSPSPSAHRGAPLFAALTVAGVWIYWPALRGLALWDDKVEIMGNLSLRSLRGLGEIWSGSPAAGPDYLPVKGTVEWILWHIAQARPEAYHATSLAGHVLSAWLLSRLLRGLGTLAASLAAFLFLVHPVAAASVGWMAELKNTLSLPLLLGSVLAFGSARHWNGSYWTSLVLFALSLLCKASGVMLPVFLLAWTCSPWAPGEERDLRRLTPFFILSLAFGLTTAAMQANRAIGGLPLDLGGPVTRLARAAHAYWSYVRVFAFPWTSRAIYPPWPRPESVAWLLTWIPVIAIGIIGHRCSRLSLRAAVIAGAFAWTTLHLLPILGVAAMSYFQFAPIADHLAYVALAGFSCLIAAACSGDHGASRILAGLVAIAVMAAALRTHRLAARFANPVSYWAAAERETPEAWLPPANLGSALLDRGDAAAALAPLRRAVELHPATGEAAATLSAAYFRLREIPSAIAAAQESLKVEPAFATGHFNLANALAADGRLPEAVVEYRAAIREEPGAVEFHFNLGNALTALGDLPAAAAAFADACRLDPTNFSAQFNLGNVLAAQNRFSEAVSHFRAASKLDPHSSEAASALLEASAAAHLP